MGQKTHPYGFRLGITKPWRSRWFAKRDYARLLHEDLKLKRDLLKQLSHAGVSSVEVERMANKLRITIFTSRPAGVSRTMRENSSIPSTRWPLCCVMTSPVLMPAFSAGLSGAMRVTSTPVWIS